MQCEIKTNKDMIVVKFEITKDNVNYMPLSNFPNKEKAQLYILALSRKNSHGYKSVKVLKNSLLYKRQNDTIGNMKYILFKIITAKNINVDTKDILDIQKLC